MKGPSFETILAARLSRRAFVGAAAAGVGLAACARNPTDAPAVTPGFGFSPIAPQNSDTFELAREYRHNVVARWGDSLVTGTPDFDTRRMTNTDWLSDQAIDAQARQLSLIHISEPTRLLSISYAV